MAVFVYQLTAVKGGREGAGKGGFFCVTRGSQGHSVQTIPILSLRKPATPKRFGEGDFRTKCVQNLGQTERKIVAVAKLLHKPKEWIV
jgi:hypothetical protein